MARGQLSSVREEILDKRRRDVLRGVERLLSKARKCARKNIIYICYRFLFSMLSLKKIVRLLFLFKTLEWQFRL
jgi:hypothetical protein